MAMIGGVQALAWRRDKERAAHRRMDARQATLAQGSETYAQMVVTSARDTSETAIDASNLKDNFKDDEGHHHKSAYFEELDEYVRHPKVGEYEKDMAAAENRSESLETLAIVAALLAGFAANDAGGFDPHNQHWTSPRVELYAFFLTFSLAGNMFVSVVGALTVMACKRVHSWDVKLMKKSPDQVIENKDYKGTMQHIFGSDKEKWFKYHHDNEKEKEGEREDVLVLKLPLNYWVFKTMCEGRLTLTGFGVMMFPYNVAAYLLAIGLNFSKGGITSIHIITWALMGPWIFLTFYGVRRMVTLFMM